MLFLKQFYYICEWFLTHWTSVENNIVIFQQKSYCDFFEMQKQQIQTFSFAELCQMVRWYLAQLHWPSSYHYLPLLRLWILWCAATRKGRWTKNLPLSMLALAFGWKWSKEKEQRKWKYLRNVTLWLLYLDEKPKHLNAIKSI